jgi:hypothetical protein
MKRFEAENNPPAGLFMLLTQIICCVVCAGFNATSAYSASFYSSFQMYAWEYGVFGFVITYFSFAYNLHTKLQKALSRPTLKQQGTATGAFFGVFAGLIAYLVFYNWPGVFLAIPGARNTLEILFVIIKWTRGTWYVWSILLFFVIYLYVPKALSMTTWKLIDKMRTEQENRLAGRKKR